jgi:predicted phosphodiesterase
MKKLTLVGDVHGKYNQYFEICKENEYTLQIGDTGYSNSILVDVIDPNKHKFFPGNHNDHNKDYDLPHCLGRFGYTSLVGVSFFYVSGAFSIDYKIRNKKYYSGEWPKTWFENEELSDQEQLTCLEEYARIMPDILITHEAPRQVVKDFTNPEILKSFDFNPITFKTRTSDFLDKLWEIKKPDIHVCGHYHKNFYKKYGNTDFFVLKELGTLEL